MNPNFTDYLLKVTQATQCNEAEVIQSLWSGYGKISRYIVHNSNLQTVVVKFIDLDKATQHPRGWNTNFSHQRKVRSYQVETNWYEQWSKKCTMDCKIPNLIGSYTEGNKQWIVLEDLNKHYPLRKAQITLDEVKVVLKWLANFHIQFLHRKPTGLWKVGTYWNLETRPDELQQMEASPLKEKAYEINTILKNCKHQTIVHGDAKLANFCFAKDGEKVAAVDFQYVGGGCGIKDVAYFLGSCMSSNELEYHEAEVLNYYFSELQKAFKTTQFSFPFTDLENEWRKLYPVACTDFIRFLSGWMPTHQKINDYNRKLVDEVLREL
ncbi:choline kinase [Tenacibaculum holothuriorum]|uniref:Choline kinase n=1 Tax=Tenacibaculum holothuriorum TaxID=1635173 RepID=A0A1Y2PE09_9FLAO|nr:oxidoreductase family protein [Tenacibaculum holothuriorum]OSY88037.1 choline kinase [Tenacibaculum holothuriorum]